MKETNMSDVIRNLSDERLIDIVRAADCIHKSLEERFPGDDKAIVELMHELKMPQTGVEKLLVAGQVFRECMHRGLQVSYPNSLATNTSESMTLSR